MALLRAFRKLKMIGFLPLFMVFVMVYGRESAVKIVPEPNGKYLEAYLNDNFGVSCDAHATKQEWIDSNNNKISSKTNNDIYVENIEGLGLLLKFQNVQRKYNNSVYTCVSDINGTSIHKSFTFLVIVPMKFVDNITNYYAEVGENVTLRCEIEAEPAAKVTWLFGDQTVEGPEYIYVEDGLIVQNITEEKYGSYTCKAFQTTMYHSDIKQYSMQLHKAVPPKMVNVYDNDTVYGLLNRTVILRCEVISDPSANVSWYRNGKQLMDDENYNILYQENRSILQLNLTSLLVFGEYTCNASNFLRSTVKNLTLLEGHIAPIPEVVIRERLGSNIKIDILTDTKELRNFQVLFRKVNDPKNWTIVNYDIKPSATNPYAINDLEPNTDYVFRAGACSAIDLCTFAAEITFNSGEVTTATATKIIMQFFVLVPAFIISFYSTH